MGTMVKDAARPGSASAEVAVVQRVYDAFARGDAAAVFAMFHPDGTIYQSSALPWGGAYQGHAGLAEFFGKLTGAVASQVETERFIDDQEGHVVAIGRTRGHVLASGRPFDVPETHVWTISDGLVLRFEAYIDTGLMREALGL